MTTGVRRRMGVEERRQQLIGVALELFSHRSPDDVSIDEIAAAAGISRPLVYHYFPGKLSLYEAALRRAADELALRFVEPQEGPLGARLLRVMGRFFAFVDDHGPGFSALMRGGPAGREQPGQRDDRRGAPGRVRADPGPSGGPRTGSARTAGAGGALVGVAGRVHRADLAGRAADPARRAGAATGARLRGPGRGQRRLRRGDGGHPRTDPRGRSRPTGRSGSWWGGSRRSYRLPRRRACPRRVDNHAPDDPP